MNKYFSIPLAFISRIHNIKYLPMQIKLSLLCISSTSSTIVLALHHRRLALDSHKKTHSTNGSQTNDRNRYSLSKYIQSFVFQICSAHIFNFVVIYAASYSFYIIFTKLYKLKTFRI